MAHGGYGKRGAAPERKKPAVQRRPKALTVNKKSKPSKPKAVSLKNQMRSIERMLRKDLPSEVKEAQEKKLEGLKKQQEIQNRLALERKIFLRNRKIKFFERRKIDRRIRRLEKQQQVSTGQVQEAEIAGQLLKLKEDLEYVRFFPKVEKYVPLFIGGDDTEIVEKRNNLRKQIKANLIAAAASGKALEETGSEDDGVLDPSDDDFFVKGSSSDEADDEWTTDKSAREQASSTSGKAASGMSGDDKNQKQISAKALMPPPRPSPKPFPNSMTNKSKFPVTSLGKKPAHNNRGEISTPGNTSSNLFMKRGQMDSTAYNTRGEIFTSSNASSGLFWKRGSTTGNSGNQSSNSDARKPKRKRRPKKKKQQES